MAQSHIQLVKKFLVNLVCLIFERLSNRIQVPTSCSSLQYAIEHTSTYIVVIMTTVHMFKLVASKLRVAKLTGKEVV